MKKLNLMGTIGGVAGGAMARVVENLVKSNDTTTGEVDYMSVGVTAVAGALINSFTKSDLLKGFGDGMVGASGYILATGLGLGESDSKVSGLGSLTAGQNAVGLLASQNAIGRLRRRRRSMIRGVEESKANSNVQ